MTAASNTVHVAIELSNTVWLVGTRLPGAEKPRMHRLAAGDVTELLRLLAELRSRAAARLGQSAAGRPCVHGNATLQHCGQVTDGRYRGC